MKTTLGRSIATALGLAALGSVPAIGANLEKIDWSAIPKSEIVLFYPGQSSQEWLLGAEHKKGGAKGLKDGKGCLDCHESEEADIGNKIVSGKRLEPKPISGKSGTVKLTVQAAYDQEYLYLRASWPSKEAGMFHEYVVYKDGKWEDYGSHRAKDSVASGKIRASYEDRFAIMLGDGKSVPAFNSQGCWITCHNDMRFMPNEAKKADVQSHPVLGKSGMKKSDIRKYLPETRTAMGDTGGWDKIKNKEEIAALKDKGVFLDLWQWRANRSNPVKMADDGYVREYRNSDAGKNPFFSNWDSEKGQPKFMFDPAKNKGRAGLSEADFRNPKAPTLNESNRAPYDPNYKWKNGDLLVKYGNDKAEGSGADNQAIGTHANGTWIVVWKRKLNTGNKDDIALKPGETYPVSFAVHEDNVTARFHHVSFPLKISIGQGNGQIKAVQIK